MSYLLLGFALAVGLALFLRWYAVAETKEVLKVLMWILAGLLVCLIAFLALTGRLGWALAMVPALFLWINRVRGALGFYRLFKNVGRMASGSGSSGQASTVETHFFKMTLDHDSGEMDGEVTDGPFKGRILSEMELHDLLNLLCEVQNDGQSVQVLEAYLDRVYGVAWRVDAETEEKAAREKGSFPGGDMSREEALEILGLRPDSTDAEIKATYHQLIAKLHPDHGGSTYLAAKINQAKDVLIGTKS